MADICTTFVKEIEKHPELYDYTTANYLRKDVTELAWTKVSKKTQISVNECKEKWRNIRSTFLRSLKLSSKGSKPKKPYYLKDHLSFILPFIRPINEINTSSNTPATIKVEEEASDAENMEEDIDEELQTANFAFENCEQIKIEPYLKQPDASPTQEEPVVALEKNQTERKRRRKYDELDGAMVEYFKSKMKGSSGAKQNNVNCDRMNLFFQSLLGEFDDMTEQDVRMFKIKTLQLIDDIKKKQRQSTPAYLASPSTSVDSRTSPIPESSTPLNL